MTALGVLVLLLFFILLATALTAWAALSMSTKRRRAQAVWARDAHAEERNGVLPAPAAKGAAASAARLAPKSLYRVEEPEAPSALPRVRVVAGSGVGGRDTQGKAARSGQKRVVRDPSELPWLRPPGSADPTTDEPGRGTPEKADRGRRKARVPRVVATDAEPQGEQGSGQAAEQGRATVSLGKVERDAFDRFLDAERRRD